MVADGGTLSKINAAAHAAYDTIKKFREEMIRPRIKSCVSWLQENMKDFDTHTVEVFWFQMLPP